MPLEQHRTDDQASFDPCRAKIVTIQYQPLDDRTGQPLGPLQILREWDNDEKSIVERFRKVYITGNNWDFIPVGNNLAFESKFMKYKLKQHCGLEGLQLGHRPMIDLKHTLVIANRGSFKGYQRFLGKSGVAKNIAPWYYSGNYQAIEKYVIEEAEDFGKAYAILKAKLPGIVDC